MRLLHFLVLFIVLIGNLSGCGNSSSNPSPMASGGIILTQVFSNLSFNAPILMLQAPGNNTRWYVVEQDGLVKTFETGDSSFTVFAN